MWVSLLLLHAELSEAATHATKECKQFTTCNILTQKRQFTCPCTSRTHKIWLSVSLVYLIRCRCVTYIINNEKSISHPGEQPLLRYPKTRKAVKPVAAHFTYSYIARPLNGGPAGYLDTVWRQPSVGAIFNPEYASPQNILLIPTTTPNASKCQLLMELNYGLWYSHMISFDVTCSNWKSFN